MSIRDIHSRCFSIAVQAHLGQEDKLGYAYIEHPMRVDERVVKVAELAGITSDSTIYLLKSISIIHDVDEDYDRGLLSFDLSGFPDIIFDVITLITHDKKRVSYKDYIKGICGSRLASIVKISDLLDNLDYYRIEKLRESEPETVDRLLKKYIPALKRICKHLSIDIDELGCYYVKKC